MVISISEFDPRKGQCQVKLEQKITFPNSKFTYKTMSILSSFVSGFQKSHSFSCMTIRNARTCVSKSDVITLPVFLAIVQQENKDIALNFFKRVVCLYVDNTHSVFMDILKNLNNVCNYL